MPKAFGVRDSHIVDATMHEWSLRKTSTLENSLKLFVVVATRPDAEAVLRVWDSVQTDAIVARTGMSVILSALRAEAIPENATVNVAVTVVKEPEEFSIRTGISVAPFSLIVAGDGNVLAAGPGLPDASFVRDGAERFIGQGSSATVKFRRLAPEAATGLARIETLLPPAPAAEVSVR